MGPDYEKLRQLLKIMPMKFESKTMHRNASMAENVGLEPTVTRIYDGVGLSGDRVCQWCLDRCGTNVPRREAEAMGMFERHPGCGCRIEYTIGDETQVQSDWTANTWSFIRDLNAIARREKFGLGGS